MAAIIAGQPKRIETVVMGIVQCPWSGIMIFKWFVGTRSIIILFSVVMNITALATQHLAKTMKLSDGAWTKKILDHRAEDKAI